jgi:protein-tyrosine phosphatase
MKDSVDDRMINGRDGTLKGHVGWKFTDIHCHCLPALDDGPSTMAEAIALCRRLAEEGIAAVIATPHQLGRYEDRSEAARVRQAVHELREALSAAGTDLDIVPGGEVRVDERICRLLEADKVLTLADGGRYILLELPHEVFINIESLLVELASRGTDAVISHAEMIVPSAVHRRILRTWLQRGAHLQLTASSLVGAFGPDLRTSAWNLLSDGWATLVATDSHDLNLRKPRARDAFAQIRAELGEDLAHRVCIENPSRVLNGQDLPAVSLPSTGSGPELVEGCKQQEANR